MAHAAKKRATYEDVLSAPSNRVAEVSDGVLSTHPRPASPLLLAKRVLMSILTGIADSSEADAERVHAVPFDAIELDLS